MNESKIEIWATWVATYIPYTSEVKRRGFDALLDLIVDAVFDPESSLSDWGDIGIAGLKDAQVEFNVVEEYVPFGATPERFQDDLAAFLGRLGFQGDIAVNRRFNLLEMPGKAEA